MNKLQALFLAALALGAACSGSDKNIASGADGGPASPSAVPGCQMIGDKAPDFLRKVGCQKDFEALASEPLDASIPGARSVKVVLDTLDSDALYFQNSRVYKIHHEFVSRHLSGAGKPVVPGLAKFNETEYYIDTRRFILGAVTYYEAAGLWAFEIAPYDTATDKMIVRAYDAIVKSSYFGKDLHFHPTSQAVEKVAQALPSRIKTKTTASLFEKIDYQPLNLASSIGRLRFVSAKELTQGEYLSFREIVVLDHVPNDLSVTMGIVTEDLQTPLSHINVLAQNRKIPNMALRAAFTNPTLRALSGKWVRFTVRPNAYTMDPVSMEEADAWWATNRPKGVTITPMDTSIKGLHDVKTIVEPKRPLREAIRAVVPAFGGKGTHFAAMARADIVPMPKPAGFIIPVYYYAQFLEKNGFLKKIDALLDDPIFRDDPKDRDKKLTLLRDEMEVAPVDPEFESLLKEKLESEYKGLPLRYRSSSSAEDLEGFAGAGLYTSKTGDPNNPMKPALNAIRKVWASVWRFRGYEERDYRNVDQKAVGMAILAHPAYPQEEMTGVAVTANPFDPLGQQPGFFVNAQPGDESVTLPMAGVTSDQFIYHYDLPGRPIVFLEHSSLAKGGGNVLTNGQIYELGKALAAIHEFFRPAYGPAPGSTNTWYGMEVDFKFDGIPGMAPQLIIKQARPHPGRGN